MKKEVESAATLPPGAPSGSHANHSDLAVKVSDTNVTVTDATVGAIAVGPGAQASGIIIGGTREGSSERASQRIPSVIAIGAGAKAEGRIYLAAGSCLVIVVGVAIWIAVGGVAAIVVVSLVALTILVAIGRGRDIERIIRVVRAQGPKTTASSTSQLLLAFLALLPFGGIAYIAASSPHIRVSSRSAPRPSNASSDMGADASTRPTSAPSHDQRPVSSTAPSCKHSTFWNPPSVSETNNTGTMANGTIEVPITVTVRESGVGLMAQVCKDGDTFMNDIALNIHDAMSRSTASVGIVLATTGSRCSSWIAIGNTTGYAQGQVFGGIWQVVSPATSSDDWNWPGGGCAVRGSPGGTCFSGKNIVLTRTCK